MSSIFVAAAFWVAPSQAATFDLIVEGGGVQQVYQLNNGNFLGLWGFDTRNFATTGGTFTTADITGYFTSGGPNIVGYYYGSNAAFNGSASEFDEITGSLTIGNGLRFFDSLWVEWTGGPLNFSSIGRTRSMNPVNITLTGDPFAVAPISLPASLWAMLAAIGGMMAFQRRLDRP